MECCILGHKQLNYIDRHSTEVNNCHIKSVADTAADKYTRPLVISVPWRKTCGFDDYKNDHVNIICVYIHRFLKTNKQHEENIAIVQCKNL